VPGVPGHESGVAVKASVAAAQVGVEPVVHPGNARTDQGRPDRYFRHVHVASGFSPFLPVRFFVVERNR